MLSEKETTIIVIRTLEYMASGGVLLGEDAIQEAATQTLNRQLNEQEIDQVKSGDQFTDAIFS